MATVVKSKPKTIAPRIVDDRPISQIVKEAVQLTHTRLDALSATPKALSQPAASSERRWPLAAGLATATTVSAGLWYGVWMLIAH